MAELTVRFDLSFGQRSMRCLMVAAMVFSAATEVASESVTLSTYYPAPSGIYAQLISTGNTYLARDSGQVGIGTSTPGEQLDVAGTNGNIRATGEIQSTMTNGGATGQIRMISGNYGAFFRNDGANTYLLLTASGNQYGGWNGLRPFYVNDSNGNVTINNMVANAGGNVIISAAEGDSGYIPNYSAWNTYGTGSGGAAIYNDATGFQAFMIVGNASAGHERRVGVWDSLAVNGSGTVALWDTTCSEVQYAIDGVTNCGGGQYATSQSGVISQYTMMPIYTNGVGATQGGTAPMLCCNCPASGCPGFP